MEFTGIIGSRGSGKTALMTAILKDYADQGIPVLANYKLNFDSVTMSFEKIREILRTNPSDLSDIAIGLDELGRGADSYEFMGKSAEEITLLIQQIRKLHSKVVYTVQRFNNIAKRLRDQTDGFILMKDLDAENFVTPDGSRVINHRLVCNGFFEAKFFNENFEYLRTRILDGSPYYEFYNTDEIIW